MSDKTLERILGRRSPEVAEHDDGDADDHGCFGWLRGVRERALMLELRKRSGHIKSFGYAWLETAEFDPSEGIILYYPGHVVRIRGANLNGSDGPSPLASLFRGILSHRVPWLTELPTPTIPTTPTPSSSGPNPTLAHASMAAVVAIEW